VAPPHLLQGGHGAPAVLQAGGEAGGGGRLVVLGGLRDELADGDHAGSRGVSVGGPLKVR